MDINKEKLMGFLNSCYKTINNTFSNTYIDGNCYISATKGKFGIYIFKNSEQKIVYIGKGGTSRNSKGKDLYFRMKQELTSGNSHSTLSKNIMEVDSITEEESKSIITDLNLSAILIGDKEINSKDSILQTEALENFLIAIYTPKYNK